MGVNVPENESSRE